jgi:Secretion system C-terminal sorting domain/Dockerin type I domain
MLKFSRILLLLLFASSSLFVFAQKPIPFCTLILTANVEASGKIIIPAYEFNAGSYDPKFSSKDLKYRVQLPAPPLGTLYDATKTSENATFDCVGGKSVALWVGNPDGFWAFCETYAYIQNDFNIPNVQDCNKFDCQSPNANKVTIQMGKSGTCSSLADFDYYVTPTNILPPLLKWNKASKNQICAPNSLFLHLKPIPKFTNKGSLDGVSTLDLVLIAKHILGQLILKDEYQLIAADVNNNGTVSTADIVALRKVILGIDTAFQNNQNWKFIDPDKKVILNGAYNTFQIKSDTTFKYGAVKIGDVNGSAGCIPAIPRDSKTYLFDVEEKMLNKDDIYTLNIENKELEGYQFTLKYDDNALELIDIDENSLQKGSGNIITSQLQGEQFKASFRVKNQVNVSDAFRMNSSKLSAEVYGKGDIFTADFNFTNKVNNGFSLGQNKPNPFSGKTQIEFSSPQKSDYQLILSDAIGREIKNMTGVAEKGANSLEVELQEKGIYFYQLKVNGQFAVKKMIVE